MKSFVNFGSRLPQTIYLTETDTVTRSLSTFSIISGMSVTPPHGTYLVIFTATQRLATANADGEFAIFKNTTQITESTRRVFLNITTVAGLIGNAHGANGTPIAKVTVNGKESISARFRATNGTIACDNRSMILLEVN